MKEQIKSGVREELITNCAALVTHIAGKERRELIAEGYGNNDSFAFDDLLTEGYIGLCKAADSFDPNMDNKFSTYAYRRIEGHIKDLVRKEKKQLMAKRNALSEPVNDADDFTDRIAASVDFRSGLKQLSEDEQKLLSAYVECNSDIDEAAALVDIPVNEAVDILLSGKSKIRKAIDSTDRVWREISLENVFDFVWLKYGDLDPEVSLRKYREDIKKKRKEKTTAYIPEDFEWFMVEHEYFSVIVDPIKRRYSVIEMNIPEELHELIPDCLR